MPDTKPNVRSVFDRALEIESQAERRAYLEEACRGTAEIRRQVEALLAAHAAAGSFLEMPPSAIAGTHNPTIDQSLAERPGSQIGPYKLIEQIGEGGMGTVWMTQQSQPVKRLVAVKLIKAGMDSRQVIARFEAERQALALMDHPNIARVLDGGTTSAGRPYFVMDLVRGTPITQYCDEHRLTPRQRLELFIPVCRAIQHAHQKGIIHRDLKPNNVLVALYDGQPVPKVIDFGVAKATGQSLTDKTLVTGFGNIVGTLEYMSPEQTEINQLDIDTRSDIYSLGVLFYELLTGTTPLERKRVKQSGMLEALRIIREEDVPTLSNRLATTEELKVIAANRGLEPAKLTKQLRGELDWIVIKALEKDRNRRYGTASDFAMDLERYLADEPVEACSPSVMYRLGKFARRHRMGVLTAGLIGLVFLLIIGGSAWIGRQLARRGARLNQEVTAAVQEATLHKELAHKLIDAPDQWEATQTMAFSALKRAEALGGGDPQLLDPALREKVQQLAARLESDQRDRLLVAAIEQIRLEKSELNFTLRHFPGLEAIPKYRQAFASCGLEVSATPVDKAAAWIAGKHPSIRNAVIAGFDEWLELESGSQEHAWLSAVVAAADADAWRNQVRHARQRHDRAALEALAESPEALSQPPATVAVLASALRRFGANDCAARFLRQAQEQHPSDFWINHTLARTLVLDFRPPRNSEAAIYYRIAIALRPRSGTAYFQLATALSQSGDESAAMVAYRKAIEFQPQFARRRFGVGESVRASSAYQKVTELDPVAAEAHTDLVSQLQASRQKADRQLAEAIEALRQTVADNPELPEAHCALGLALGDQGRFPEALAALERGHELGSKRANWRYPSARWIAEYRRFAELDDKVAAILAGTQRPRDTKEGLELAEQCAQQGLHLSAARLYERLFSVDPTSAKRRYRLLAACAAAMAGCRRGNDSSQLDEEESLRWRKQAVAWLRVDLDAWAGKMGDKSQPFRESVRVTLQYIKDHSDLAGLRDEGFLEQLPEPERAAYRQLWRDVETIFAETANDRR